MTVLLDTAGRGVLSECPTSAVNPADGHQPDARSRSDQLQATSGNDRQGNASESASSESYSTRQLWLFRHPRLYESLREFRSLVRRIQTIWRSTEAPPVYTGQVWQSSPDGNYQPDTRMHARKQGIAALLDSQPLAIVQDCRVFLPGW